MAGPGPRTAICLLRHDLRYHDSEVLHWAQNNADYIIPLYCFDPRQYLRTYYYGFPKTGPHRLKFLLESVKDLRQTLKKKGSNLVVRKGNPEDVVHDLITQLGTVAAVAFHEEATKEELDVEKALQRVCAQHGVKIQTFWASTLYHRDDLPFSHISRLPDVYTQFRKAVEAQAKVRPTVQMADQLKPLAPGVEDGCIPVPEEFGQKDPLMDPRTAFPCSGGETQALMRLQHYFWDTNLVASYKETRNGLIGIDYSTKFAPWLALGCISPRYIYEQIRKYEKERTANQSTYWVIFELLWRDYFRFVALKYGTRIFLLKGLQDKEVPWKKDPKLLDAWKEGRTGVPFVDANMRELAATGFMSNRGRQNVASFLTKDLGLDWRMGAEWFEYLLVDYDVCSNYGNWLYSAGIGNDPRENRKFNMIKQGLDYDSNGDYVRLWVPEIQCVKGGEIHTLWALSNAALSQAGIALGETYPLPVVLAQEWSRHIKQKPNKRDHPPRGRKDPSDTPRQHKDRGVDFYFSRNKDLS
ncbi:cryptochrome DASH-like isoform X2 [Dermochelys coriacea]|uniref:cryptochrome DASH-like isoform X2 n=1 Tax=Dermochelys coriacea TaxID=27794 RepID=UPI0018E74101|nr:cryptochrome DASH-like isoform X2 [Dermochelys coriacea]